MAGTLLTVQCEGHAQRAIETLRAVGVFGHRDGCTALPENKDNALSRSLNTRKKIAFYIILYHFKLLEESIQRRDASIARVSSKETTSRHKGLYHEEWAFIGPPVEALLLNERLLLHQKLCRRGDVFETLL